MAYKHQMTDREVVRAALKILRDNATLIADHHDSNRVWHFLEAVEANNVGKTKDEEL